MLSIGENYEPFHTSKLSGHGLEQGHKSEVDKYVLVLGMVDDVDDLVVRKTRVDGMANRTDTRDRIIELKMPIPVPRQGRNSIVLIYAQPGECVGEL